jgi:YYY domain-containing protein
MLRKRTLLLFLLAFVLRLLLQGWDYGITTSSHPDERQVGFVTEKAEGWFADPDFYAYGSLHFQAIRLTATVLGLGDNLRGLVVSGRALSLLASMLAMVLGWLIASRAWGRRTADLFVLLAAWVPLDLQQSHYTTVEAHHAAWVMAALAACFWLARSGRPLAAAASGAAIGASLAVKVASVALGLPLVLAVLLAVRGRGLLAAARLLAIAGAAGMAGFWLCQPWAFANGRPPYSVILVAVLVAVAITVAEKQSGRRRAAMFWVAIGGVAVAALQLAALVGLFGETVSASLGSVVLAGAGLNPSYLEGVGREIAMVVGRSDLAYVRIYAHTLPVLYPLRELAIWGWGALLLLATLAGSGAGCWWLAKRWRRCFGGYWNDSSIVLAIILAWLVPMTLRLSTLQVKFLRYWEPLVVPAALIASWWLMRLPRKLRCRAAAAVIAGTVLWGLAYSWAFIEPHPHRLASDWINPMLGDGQVVAFEHWDEHIDLRPSEGIIERAELPSYELPDAGRKIELWTSALANADWVILTSNRVFRTVLANPERFPQTARLYRLLFSGEAGFEILTRARRGPRIFGIRWPVQRADESFLNYEFPQVLIFGRIAEVDAEDLAARIRRPLPYLEHMGYAEIERNFLNRVPTIPPVPSKVRQILDLSIWVVVFSGFGLAAWVLLLPLLRGWPDAGIGLALATGWIVLSWLMWMGSELRIWGISPATGSCLFLALLIAGAVTTERRWPEITTIIYRRRSGIITVVAVAIVIGALFLVIRAWNPAIHWGEKPMDFSFLNAFLRAPHWPPGEPWMAGMPLHYYYFGEVLAAFPMLVASCSAGVGYNLISATIPALFAAVLASVGLLLTRRRRLLAASVLPLLALLTGNLAWPWLIETWRKGNIFDLWWATSRVIPGFAIDEYPLWTTLFADLHGHFIAFPVLVATFAWGWLCVEASNRKWITSAALCGIGAAVVVATNPWDLFILTSTLAFGVLMAARHRLRGLIRLGVAAAVSVLAAAPFIVELMAGFHAGAGERGIFLTAQEFAPAWAILRHFGLFMIPMAALAFVTLGRRFWIALPTVAIGIIAGLSFKSSAAALSLAMCAVFATVAARSKGRLDRLGWSMAALGMLAIAASERFTLIDRMNTIFKVYNGVWIILAFALAAALMRTRGRPLRVLLVVWTPLQIVAIANLPLGIAQGWVRPRISSPRPSLDGQAFLATQDPETWFLVRGLQAMAGPDETVAEAAGPSYREFARIAMHTGQPTVVGWDWHLQQRGQPVAEIRARFNDLEELYGGGRYEKRRDVLDRFRVRWAVAAKVERSHYKISNDDPLGDISGVRNLARRDGAVLYRVVPGEGRDAKSTAYAAELPPGMIVVGRLGEVKREVVRSIALDDRGATAILRDGSLVELDLAARHEDALPAPPCMPTAVARQGEGRWAACEDGSLWRRTADRWNPAGLLAGTGHVVADEGVWAWGPAGLWRFHDDSEWREVFSGGVTAAAAYGQRVVWSDGSRVWLGEGGKLRRVGESLDGVRALARQGSELWALDSAGLHSAGSSELPWRRRFDATDRFRAMAGNNNSLWLVLEDGLVIEPEPLPCPSPWAAHPAGREGSLREPRGLAVSPAGWFAVADTFNHRIVWYTDQGRCLDQVGSEGEGPGEFREPSSVAIAGDGSVAVADTWNGRIQVLRPNGVTEVFGAPLFGPRDLIWAPDGSLLVSDTGNRKLLRFTPPTWSVETIATLPGPPVGLEWAAGLIATAVPADGAVLLVNATDGEVVRRIELPCWGSRDQQEGYLALLPSGNLVASSPANGELWIVDPSGERQPRLVEHGLAGITAIALTPAGDLLASLTWEHRLVRLPVGD